MSKDSQTHRRLTGFVLASLALHAVLLIAVQLVAQRRPVTVAPEPLPVQFVELEPPAGMEAPVPQEIPDQPPLEVPQIPEPQPDQPVQPDIPDEPPEQPEIPEEPAETPDIPAPEPSPAEPEPQTGVTTVSPPEEEGASLIVPGLTYSDRADSAIARFSHVIECATLGRRYDPDCADVGPVYLTEREYATLMPGGRLAPEIEAYFRAQNAWEAERAARIERNSNAPVPNPNVCGDFACIPETGWGRLLESPAVRRALEEAGAD